MRVHHWRAAQERRRVGVRASLHEFSGDDMLSMRVYVGQDIGQAKPTQKGLTMNVTLLPKLIGILQEAEAKARAEGLIE